MAWTSPRTWVAGETVTAAIMNTHVRDNFKAIGDPWTAYTPTIVNVGASGITGRWLLAGKTAEAHVTFTLTGAPTGAVTISLPTTANGTLIGPNNAPVGLGIGNRSGTGWFNGLAYLATATTLSIISNAGAVAWGPAVPAAWTAADIWAATFRYEAA